MRYIVTDRGGYRGEPCGAFIEADPAEQRIVDAVFAERLAEAPEPEAAPTRRAAAKPKDE